VIVTETVNGHPLPAALVKAFENGRWAAPTDPGALAELARLTGEEPFHPAFYAAAGLERENAAWPAESDPVYLGEPDPERPPGDLDPARSVLIADLGPDRPLALDYRQDPPTVVYLTEETGRWVRVAGSVEEFLAALGG
jgi:hypothetical protein